MMPYNASSASRKKQCRKVLPVPEVVIIPCPLYQSENCQLPMEHVTDGITYTHCCGYCQRTGGKKHGHPETSCNKKREADCRKAKNAKRRKKSPPEIEPMPLSTAPRRRPNSPRTTDPNSQGTGPNHRLVRSRRESLDR